MYIQVNIYIYRLIAGMKLRTTQSSVFDYETKNLISNSIIVFLRHKFIGQTIDKYFLSAFSPPFKYKSLLE